MARCVQDLIQPHTFLLAKTRRAFTLKHSKDICLIYGLGKHFVDMSLIGPDDCVIMTLLACFMFENIV